MHRMRGILMIFFLTVFISSCNDQWKEPAQVNVNFQSEQSTVFLEEGDDDEYHSYPSPVPNSEDESDEWKIREAELGFSEAYIVINKMEIKGHRKQGDNLTIEKDQQRILHFDTSKSSIPANSYDFPQGTYSPLDTKIRFESIVVHAELKFLIENYHRTFFETWKIELHDMNGMLNMPARNSNGGQKISIVNDHSRQLNFNMQMMNLFSDISLEEWLESKSFYYNHQVKVVVSKHFNANIHEQVINNMEHFLNAEMK